MQSTDEMGCDELTDDSGAVDICAHCASENKLQPGLYYCFQCGSFGRYMCGDCNKQHRKYAHGHDVKSIKDAAQQKKQNIDSYERGCDASKDDSGATDICAHCASDSDIRPAVYFCFHCGPFGRYMCEDCNKYHKKFANAHEVRKLLNEAVQTRQYQLKHKEKPKIPPRPRQKPIPAEPTQIKADIAQLTTKSGEAGERICDSGLTDTSDNIQATTTSTAEKEKISNSGKEVKTPSVPQWDQGNSPKEQNQILNISEIRKHDSNVEDIEQQVVEMQIQAAENYRSWNLCPSGYLFVAAIEIDTNYTNYAFSIIDDFSRDPLKISSPKWLDKDGYISTSPPPCILFDKNREFHSFGPDAENNYSKFAMMDIHKDYYFFRGFKIDKLGLKRDLMLVDEMGKPMLAIDVFSGYIKYFRQHCSDLSHRLYEITDSEIRWVLVVPGIFNDTSELLMREAAEKAGINSQNLRLVLRPEAASMHCQNLPGDIWKGHDDRLRPFAPHSKYLVCDAGDFDINITAHEVMEDGCLKAFYKTSFRNCGEYFTQKAFRDFLASVVGNDVMDEFQATQIWEYNLMFDYLHKKMRTIKTEVTQKISIRVSGELDYAFEKARGKSLKDHIKTISQYENKLTLMYDVLRIDSDLFYGLFVETCDVAASFLHSLFNLPQVEHVSTILMVGKFSECAMLQDVIMKKLPNKRFIIPKYASEAVLKGAVIFGHSID